METVVYVAGGALVVGVVIAYIVHKHKKTKLHRSQLLEECFGKPMQTNRFSVSEVRDWIRVRENLLKDDSCKAAVLKANENVLKSVGTQLDIGTGLENFMILVIIDGNSKIIESTLVKYDELDKDLKNLLGEQGIVVIEK